MKHKRFWAAVGNTLAAVTVAFVMTLVLALGAGAQGKYRVLHRFNEVNGHPDGAYPLGNLVLDAAGNLYGTTYWGYGGACQWHGCGSAFELTPNQDGSWTREIIFPFSDWGPPGAWPASSLIFDAAGNLYGTAEYGSATDCGIGPCGGGVVYQLTPNAGGYWTENVLYTFSGGSDGGYPVAGLAFDTAGNLYGTTTGGGSYFYGVVFKLTKESDGSWTESVLHSFTGGKDGANPYAGLTIDAAGNLYGTTVTGGKLGFGNVFKMTLGSDGKWREFIVHPFSGGKDGANPYASLVLDAAGNLYGTTANGGSHGFGNAFKFMLGADGIWRERVLHQFAGGNDGANPYAGLVLDAAGNLYGTTANGGAHGFGTVFTLTLGSDGTWSEHVLHVFAGQPARTPYAGVILDAVGNLYGTTAGGSSDCNYYLNDCGAVFEIMP